MSEEEMKCGINCIRKFDKTYRLYENMEKRILESYMKDNDIDLE